jgi:hypothetical protein
MNLKISNLQQIWLIPNQMAYLNACNLFDTKPSTKTELNELAEAYGTLIFYANLVKELSGTAHSIHYGGASPYGLMEFISDHATAARSVLDDAEEVTIKIDLTEIITANKKGQKADDKKVMAWYGESGSGS